MKKNTRQALILELINKYRIETQSELADRLIEAGENVTQATVSRDIKSLKLIKVSDSHGKTFYSTMDKPGASLTGKMLTVYAHAFISAENGGNIVVVKTLNGMAQAVAAAIDSLKIDEIIGTIAGDNTIFLAAKSEEIAASIVETLRGLVK